MRDEEIRLAVVYKRPITTLDIAEIGKILNSPLSTIIAGDIKAKNTSWNSSRTNSAGDSLERYLDNRTDSKVTAPETPTHYPDNSNHTTDVLGIAILKIGSLQYYLENLTNEISSNYTPILLDILMQSHQIPLLKPLRTVNWGQFEEDTKVNTRINANVKNIAQIDTLIDQLTITISSTLEEN